MFREVGTFVRCPLTEPPPPHRPPVQEPSPTNAAEVSKAATGNFVGTTPEATGIKYFIPSPPPGFA